MTLIKGSSSESSTEELDVNADSSTAADVNQQTVENTESSTVESEAPKTSFEAVLKALGKEQKPEGEADGSGEADESANGEGDGKGKSDEQAEKTDATDDEILEKLDPKSAAHKRIRQLVQVRDELEPDANNFRSLREWTAQSGLTSEEFTTGLSIMSAMRNDPYRALELIAPYYEQLLQVTGEQLPDDIQKMVDEGTIADPEVARELARSRSKASHLTQQQERRQQESQQQEQERLIQQTAMELQDEADKWDAQWRSKDPDYKHKEPFVNALIENKLNELAKIGKLPKTRADVRSIAEEALKTVEDRLRGSKPPKNEIKHVTGTKKPTQSTSAPQSSLEAARLALKAG